MKIAVTGKDSEDVKVVRENLKQFGFQIVAKNPDIVISYGGDGSFLFSEHKYPGVPKLITRSKSLCNQCVTGELTELMEKIKQRKYKIKEFNKLKVVIKKKKRKIQMVATSDVIIRNIEQFHAIRFNLFIGKEKKGDEFIGDGIVVANPVGSTGYFYSITKKKFDEGIGIALNNTTTKENYYLSNNVKVKFLLNRNPAGVSVDNVQNISIIEPGDTVEIQSIREKVKIIYLE